jgi:Ribbon-helix-helix protein, copG family
MKKAQPREQLKPIGIKVSEKMLQQLREEMRRTGLSRSALLKAAWADYMDRPKATAPR